MSYIEKYKAAVYPKLSRTQDNCFPKKKSSFAEVRCSGKLTTAFMSNLRVLSTFPDCPRQSSHHAFTQNTTNYFFYLIIRQGPPPPISTGEKSSSFYICTLSRGGSRQVCYRSDSAAHPSTQFPSEAEPEELERKGRD